MRVIAILATTVTFAAPFIAPASGDVFNMGGTRDPSTGQWTGLASLEFVTVGDPGNTADTVVMSDRTTGYGAVGYTYKIGTYDVTAGQYCRFLNAVAKTGDPYMLYNPYMGTDPAGCGISRDGNAGNYTYTVTKDPNLPVNRVSWGDAARFCNWLSNSQPTGVEGPGTTETGSYTLNGDFVNLLEPRNPGATYVLPTENEWYKAAYYKGGSSNAGYWLYPTQSDDNPDYVLSSTATNSANYYGWNGSVHVYTDPSNYLTAVGSFAGSPGPYGTFDAGGNVYQWNEAIIYDWCRGLRGGSFSDTVDGMLASTRGFAPPGNYEPKSLGFRVALVPEPATLALLALGGPLLARRRRA